MLWTVLGEIAKVSAVAALAAIWRFARRLNRMMSRFDELEGTAATAAAVDERFAVLQAEREQAWSALHAEQERERAEWEQERAQWLAELAELRYRLQTAEVQSAELHRRCVWLEKAARLNHGA